MADDKENTKQPSSKEALPVPLPVWVVMWFAVAGAAAVCLSRWVKARPLERRKWRDLAKRACAVVSRVSPYAIAFLRVPSRN